MSQKSFSRADRFQHLVHEEVAKIMLRHLENPHFSGVTVTAAKLSRDLAHAKIYVTFLHDADINVSLKNLNQEVNFINRELRKQLNHLRVVPRVFFYYDSSVRDGRKLSALIDAAIASDEAKNKFKSNVDEPK